MFWLGVFLGVSLGFLFGVMYVAVADDLKDKNSRGGMP